MDKGDWGTFCMCLEPESHDKYAAKVAFDSAFEIAFSEAQGGDAKKQADAIRAVFAKHGITEKMLAAEPTGADDSIGKRSLEDAKMDFVKPIKNRTAFIIEMGNLIGDQLKKSLPIQAEAKLSDVKENGDTAKGTITYTRRDKKQTDAIGFKKVDGSWGIELTDGP